MDLKDWRERLRLSQPDMAHYLGVSEGTYRQWERSRRNLGSVLQRLCQVLMRIEVEAPDLHRELVQPLPKGQPGRPRLRDVTEPEKTVPEWLS